MTGPNQHQERPWKSGDVVKDAQLLYELLMHTDGLTVEQDHRLHGILTIDIPRLEEQYGTLRDAAQGLVSHLSLREPVQFKETDGCDAWNALLDALGEASSPAKRPT